MKMDFLKDFASKFKSEPSDVVGLDISADCMNAVRMRKTDTQTSVLAVDSLPLPETLSGNIEDIDPLILPPRLRAKYVSLALDGEDGIIKLLSFPGQFNEESESKIMESMGIENPNDYRISYKVITEGHANTESKVLVTAVPADKAQRAINLFPVGLPAPFSLELSIMATMTAFAQGPGTQFADTSVGIINFSSAICSFALFNKNSLALIRKFDSGLNSVLDKVQESLGVDRETALGIITDGAFDISQAVNDVLDPILKQMAVSRDFVERRENCHVSTIYIAGGIVVSRDAIDTIRSALGVDIEVWNPMENLTIDPAAVISEEHTKQSWRFSGALGACLATLEEA